MKVPRTRPRLPRREYPRPTKPFADNSDKELQKRVWLVGGRIPRRDEKWNVILRRDPCSWCGGPAGTVDHITPVRTGGPLYHTPWNSTAACPTCNAERGDASVLAYLVFRLETAT